MDLENRKTNNTQKIENDFCDFNGQNKKESHTFARFYPDVSTAH